MRFLILFLLIVISDTYSQVFNKSPLVQLPGKNTKYDFLLTWYPDNQYETAFICFENQIDNIYSIMLKQLSPITSDNIIVYSDSTPQINPTISFTSEYDVRIVWQSWINSRWQLLSRIYSPDSLSSVIQLTDNFEDCTSPSLYFSHLCWIQGSDLKMGILDDSLHSFITIDDQCSNPEIIHESYVGPLTIDIVYEKKIDSLSLIKYAIYDDRIHTFQTSTLSDSSFNINPRFGYSLSSVCYQKLVGGFWRAVICYPVGYTGEWVSDARIYNIENPVYFTYPIPTKDNNDFLRDFFLIYESDSIPGNKEIILESYPQWSQNLKINLSNMTGDDTFPYATVLDDSVVIFWINSLNEFNSQIWWAKIKFNPYTKIENESLNHKFQYSLYQNYPNPFNPITNISFHIENTDYISLVIYDNLGRQVRDLFHGLCQSEYHNIIWDGKNNNGIEINSGNYFYILHYQNTNLSKKMQLLK